MMLGKRIFSAVIAIGIGGPLIIFLGPYAVYIFTFIIAAGCLHEYFSMIIDREESNDIRLLGIFVGVLILVLSVFFRYVLIPAVVLALMFYCVYFLFRAKNYSSDVAPGDGYTVGKSLIELALSIFGIVFFSLLLSYLPMLRDVPNGLEWVIVLMAVVWLGDTGAYFIGTKFGKKKLYRQISPNKSIEGSLGGILFSFVAVVVCKIAFFHELDYIDCINIGVVGGVFGQLGDLVESMIKRSVAVKDSGIVMPGHGGFFDRFDGLIFAVPFFYFYARSFF